MSDSKENKSAKKETGKGSNKNLFVVIIIGLIIFTFIFSGGPMLGLKDFVSDFGKKKEKNEDGTFSIQSDAQVAQNSNNRNSYVGRVLNEKIQLGVRDEFNIGLSQIKNSQLDPYTKYQYARYYFENAINKIIGMKKAKELGIEVSRELKTLEVGKRYFVDASGDVDFDAMRKNRGKVNEYSKSVVDSIVYENFENDTFNGLPLTKDEVLDTYKLENVKVSVKYVNISNKDADNAKVNQFYEANKNSYKMYKLTRLVFKDKKEAEKALMDIKNDSNKFLEVGNKLKSEDKVINIVYDPSFAFGDDFENDAFKKAVKSTEKGNIYQAVVDSSNGPIIFKVQDVDAGDFANERVYQKVKADYIAKNTKEIDGFAKKTADEIFILAKTAGLEKAASSKNLKVESMEKPVEFMGYGIPYVRPDATDDKNFIAKIFKAKKGDVVEPFKHDSGYMIAMVTEKKEVNMEDFENLYDELNKNYSSQKTREISSDYYLKERKKYEIIDNFKYVINMQYFMDKEEK
jgi:hypothetical protein